MHIIEKTNFGFKLTFSDFILADEMKQFLEASEKSLLAAPIEFCVFIDARELKPMIKEAMEYMRQAQVLYKKLGLRRSVVVFNNILTQNQFKMLAMESGIEALERRVDSSKTPDWKNIGLNWILKGIEPVCPAV